MELLKITYSDSAMVAEVKSTVARLWRHRGVWASGRTLPPSDKVGEEVDDNKSFEAGSNLMNLPDETLI